MVRHRLAAWLDVPEEDRFTLGVITFNSEQQSLILDLLDRMRRENPQLEWFFSEDREEPVIVKNLENIQGDERDVMLFSVTYGPDVQGKLTMNFGPLNNAGGERRLNVAVTRARRELHVFSSILAEQIDLNPRRSQGVRDFKAFLDYAERGSMALPAMDEGSLGPAENAFEDAVAEAFERKGWEVRTQVGVSGFRIDLAVVHPDRAGSYLCGIECDGARYHSSATARDRDKIRQAVLEGLGWSIIRIWSTDWFRNAGAVIERADSELGRLLEEDRKRAAEEAEARQSSDITVEESDATVASESPVPRASDASTTPSAQQLSFVEDRARRGETNQGIPLAANRFAETAHRGEGDVTFGQPHRSSGLALDAGRFFDVGYSAVLRSLILSIAEAEGPLPLEVLARRVAQEHGWQRTGKRILQRVRENLETVECHAELARTFVWAPGTHVQRVPFRGLEDRPIRDVSRSEIASVIDDNAKEIASAEDPMLVLARLLGIARLSGGGRAYLEECAAWCREGESTRTLG